MGLKKALGILCVALTALLLVQLRVFTRHAPQETWVAHWARNPKSIDETKNLAGQIVRGRVTGIREADDLVMKVPGEPNDTDSIPVEVITLAVEGAYKGTPPATVELFHTGLSPLDERDRPIPPRPRGVRAGTLAAHMPLARRTVLLADDPGYALGERYVLFLTDGPTVTVAGTAVKTQALVSPEGRYAVTQSGTLVPHSRLPFAGQLRGQKLSVLEGQLPKFKPPVN